MSLGHFNQKRGSGFSKPDFWHHSSIWSLSSSLVGIWWRWWRLEETRCRGRCASCWPGGLCKQRSWGNGGRSPGASGCRSGVGPPRTSGCSAPPGSGLFLLWPVSPDSPRVRRTKLSRSDDLWFVGTGNVLRTSTSALNHAPPQKGNHNVATDCNHYNQSGW